MKPGHRRKGSADLQGMAAFTAKVGPTHISSNKSGSQRRRSHTVPYWLALVLTPCAVAPFTRLARVLRVSRPAIAPS